MFQTYACHYWVLLHVSAKATIAPSLGRGNINEEQKLTLSDSTYSSQSLLVLWFDFNQTINNLTAKFNRTLQAQGLAPSSFYFLGTYHLFVDYAEITLHRNWSKTNGEFMYKKTQDTHSAVWGRLKRSWCIISTSWPQSTVWQQYSQLPKNLTIKLPYRQDLCRRETRMWKFIETFKPSFKSFSGPKVLPPHRFLSPQFKQGRTSIFLSLQALYTPCNFFEIVIPV